MFTRMLEFKCKPGKAGDVCHHLGQTAIRTLRKNSGFVDAIVLVSGENPNLVTGMSFWNTPEDAERFQRESYGKLEDQIKDFLQSPLTLHTFNVDTFASYEIAEGLAA
jgi:quinol monooxygenase YgiN